jgi:glyoxylase-like metal-dependent hydrolase (beta-lactamase superfamily II)
MKRWKIGDVTITCIREGSLGGLLNHILPQATPTVLQPMRWLFPHFVDEAYVLRGFTQAFVVQTASRRLIVDTCIGNDKNFDPYRPAWSRMQTSFLQDLIAAGFPPDSIDTVLCTHMHADHIGWNTTLRDGKWLPTFGNARYLFGRIEYEAEQIRNRDPSFDDLRSQALRNAAAESIAPVFEAGLADLVEAEHGVCDEVRLVPTHGHTAGHVSVHIASNGEEALITGDFIHHPCQLAHPDWATQVDFDKARSSATRRQVFARLADTPALLIGSHFAEPIAGRIVRDGDAYRLDFPGSRSM